jgi:hypothetical protein
MGTLALSPLNVRSSVGITPAMPKLVTSSEERLREVIEQVGTRKATLIGTAVMPLGWNTWRCVRSALRACSAASPA